MKIILFEGVILRLYLSVQALLVMHHRALQLALVFTIWQDLTNIIMDYTVTVLYNLLRFMALGLLGPLGP